MAELTGYIPKHKIAVYTSAQVRELDRIAIEDFGMPGYELMTRAAQATFDRIQQYWPQAGQLCVLCGAGNNAGDGYVIARLALQAEWQVTLYSLVATERLQGDAAQAWQDFVAAGGIVTAWQGSGTSLSDPAYSTEETSSPDMQVSELHNNAHESNSPRKHESQKADFHSNSGVAIANQPGIGHTLIVDALLGTGLTRDVSGIFAEAVQWINTVNVPVVSVDIPSGLDGDTGQVRGCTVKATHTVTYIGMKQGLLTGQARDYTGMLHFDALGVADKVYAGLPVSLCQWIISGLDVAEQLPPRSRCAHKGHFGHSLLIGGNQGMSGAIRLAGEAALRTGSGLVTVATHSAHADRVNQSRPELMVAALQSTADLRQLLAAKTGKVAIGIGPGLGQDRWAQALLLLALEAEQPLVIDADALNLLARLPRRQDNWILTPHPAEAARLLGCATTEIERDRVTAVRRIQQHFGGVCVLKGAGTLVSNGAEIAFCNAGNPGMASGGMGDVLSGIITALLAQGLTLFEAAYTGVQVHAMAADAAARSGERGMIAGDVLAQLRGVVNQVANQAVVNVVTDMNQIHPASMEVAMRTSTVSVAEP